MIQMSEQLTITEAMAAELISANKSLRVMPFYISGWLDSLFMGLVIAQAFSYGRFIREDRKGVVALVFASVAGTIAATVCILAWMSDLFVWNYGSYIGFVKVAALIRYLPIEIVTVLIVQSLYVDWSRKLHRHWWPVLVTIPFMLAALGTGIGLVAVMNSRYPFLTPVFLEDPLVRALVYSWLGFTVVADLLISGSIVLGLYRVKTGWTHTDSVIRKLIFQCFESQTPALISSVIVVIVWNRQTEVAIAFIALQTKVYVVALLITLNLRTGVIGGNASHPSATGSVVRRDPTYPLATFPVNAASPQAVPTLEQTSWHPSRRSHGNLAVALARQTSSDEAMDDKYYGSTTGLTLGSK